MQTSLCRYLIFTYPRLNFSCVDGFCLKLKLETSYGVSFFHELGFFSIFIPRRYWLLLFVFRLQQGIRYNFGIIGWRSTQAARMPLSPLSANKGSSSLLWMSKSSSTLTVRLDHGSQSLHISTIAFHIDHHCIEWQKCLWCLAFSLEVGLIWEIGNNIILEL